MAHYSCEMTSAGSKLLSAKEDVFKYQRTEIAFNCKINCVKCLLAPFFFFTILRVVSTRTYVTMSYPAIRTTGFLG